MKTKLTFFLLTITVSFSLQAQDEGYMYGKITTVDDRTYEGPIRWGKEEVLWVDLFNVGKPENDNLKYLTRDEIHYLQEKKYEHNRNWGDRWFGRWVNEVNFVNLDEEFAHQFVCQFGDIKSIKPSWRSRSEIVLRNGVKMEVNGDGYNDLGSDIRIMDKEIGEVSLDWDRISLIEFQKTPSKLENKFGEALYGTVESSRGTFTGFIAWDNDERLSTDKLDGSTSDGKVSITFSNIASIEQDWDEARVKLESGRELRMCCSNDVNNENRGIVVDDEKKGKVSIPWREFDKLTFSKAPKMRSYDEFQACDEINGTVTTEDGKTLSGKIIYDLDEIYTCEIIQGMDNKTEYFLPIRSISRISPRGWNSSTVELKNGTSFTLEEGQDVSELHQGILVFAGGRDPIYIHWENVKEIKFN